MSTVQVYPIVHHIRCNIASGVCKTINLSSEECDCQHMSSAEKVHVIKNEDKVTHCYSQK